MNIKHLNVIKKEVQTCIYDEIECLFQYCKFYGLWIQVSDFRVGSDNYIVKMHYLLQYLYLRSWILSRQRNSNIFDKKECLFRTMNFTAPGSRLLVFRWVYNDYTGQGYNVERLFVVLKIYSIMSLNFLLQFLNNIIRI